MTSPPGRDPRDDGGMGATGGLGVKLRHRTATVTLLLALTAITACGGDDAAPVACVPVSDAVASRFGEPVGATVADDTEDGQPRWVYGRPDDVLFISDIDPEGGGAGVVRPLTANATTYATEQRSADGSDFPDDGPAALSFASNESDAAGGRATQCAAEA